jgi:hypothetical protein
MRLRPSPCPHLGLKCYSASLAQPEPTIATPKWLLALAALFLIGLFSTEMTDPDSWWHLATGRYIVTQHRLPVPDPFAYTTASAPPADAGEAQTRRFNLTHEWLAQAVWYGFEALGGIPAVVLWKSLLLTILCGLTGFVSWRRTRSGLWGIAAALGAASLAIEFAHDRPAILGYVFTALFIAIFDDRRRIPVLPALAIVWANCHGSFFLGWVVCGAYALEALIRRAPDLRRVLLATGSTILLSGLNPNGFAAIATVLRYRQSALQSTLIEWSRADLWGPPYAFDLLLYGAALSLLIGWRRVRIADWLLFVAFAAASLVAFRNEMLIGLLAPILIASYFPIQQVKLRPPIAARMPYAAGAVLLVGLAWGSMRGSFFQLRAADWQYPAGAVAFLREHGLTGHLFNTYEYGGYLIWRGVPVFIDGRALSESVFEDYRKILGTPPGDPVRDEILARYGIRAIVINSFEYNSGVLYPLALSLGMPSAAPWELVYQDAQSMLFLHDVPAGIPVLDKRGLIDHFETECRAHVDHNPTESLCARTLADLAMRSGDRERAKRLLAFYLAHPYADDPEARRAYLGLVGQ